MLRRMLASLLLGVLLIPATSSVGMDRRPPDHGLAVLVESGQFFVGFADTGRKQYHMAVWKKPSDFEGVRVIVSRTIDADPKTAVVEDVIIGESSLTYSFDGSFYSMRFAATLPMMGAFDLTFKDFGPTRQTWSGTDRLRGVVATRTGMLNREMRGLAADKPDQIAGGAPTGLQYFLWGTQATGVLEAPTENRLVP